MKFNDPKNYQHLTIEINEDKKVAPRYQTTDIALVTQKCVITEKGTEANLPIVDFVMRDEHGKLHYMALTGRMVLGIAAAIKGVNVRNHGVAEP